MGKTTVKDRQGPAKAGKRKHYNTGPRPRVRHTFHSFVWWRKNKDAADVDRCSGCGRWHLSGAWVGDTE